MKDRRFCSYFVLFGLTVGASQSYGGSFEQSSAILGKISLTAPQSALQQDAKAFVKLSSPTDVQENFESTAGTGSSGLKMLPEVLRIQVTKAKPKAPLKLDIRLPDGISKPSLLALVFYDGEHEAYDFFEEVSSIFDPQTRRLTANIEPKLFSASEKDSKAYEATLVIALPKK